MMRSANSCLWALMILLAHVPLLAQPEKVTVDQVFMPSVTIEDNRLIQFFLNELLISEDKVDSIQILDIGRNGFGEKDLVRTFPSGDLYFVFPSDTLQRVMDRWQFEANYQIVADAKDTAAYASTYEAPPQGRILASLLAAVDRNYAGKSLKLRLERTASNVVFEMWAYDPSRLISDEAVVEDKTFDVVFVYRTVVDTVFVSTPPGQQQQ
jgi:hypothetical protein